MAIKIFSLLMLLSSFSVLAARQQYFDVLGTSPKGQFVALEEYGFHPGRQVYYVTIRVMNVWRKIYVGRTIKVELPAEGPGGMIKAREKAKLLSVDELKKFKVI
jgi:predicted secreted protein